MLLQEQAVSPLLAKLYLIAIGLPLFEDLIIQWRFMQSKINVMIEIRSLVQV